MATEDNRRASTKKNHFSAQDWQQFGKQPEI